jgi:large subunit ribosomal protein L29
MTKAKELVTYDKAELERQLSELRRELVALKFQAATGQLSNSARVSFVKKEIARILTVLRESELGIAHIPPKSTGKIKYVKQAEPTKDKKQKKSKVQARSEESNEDSSSFDKMNNESDDDNQISVKEGQSLDE